MKQFVYEPKSEQHVTDKLVNLYGSHLVEFYTALENLCRDKGVNCPSLPLILRPKNNGRDWEQASITVMIFTRETSNWKDGQNNSSYNFKLSNSDDVLKEIYRIQDIYDGYCESAENDYKSSFTKDGFDTFVTTLNENNVIDNIKVEAMWNSLSKVNCIYSNPTRSENGCGVVSEQINNCVMEHFNVIKKEIYILKPDIIIFMAEKESEINDYIENIFSADVKYQQLSAEGVDQVFLPGIECLAYRVVHKYHDYLYYLKKQRDEMFAAILYNIWQKITNKALMAQRTPTHKLL